MTIPTYVLLALAAVVLAGTSPIRGQITAPNRTATPATNRPPDSSGSEIYGGYMIGAGDILDIHVNDEDGVSGRYQVDQDGKVKVPLLSGAIPAAGTTTFEFASRLRDELKKQDILREPSVTVLIARGMTQNVSVLGAVMRPGIYPIEKPTTLVDLISLAGGLAPNVGSSLTISHHADAGGPNIANASVNTDKESTRSTNLTTLMSAKDLSANLAVHAGDVVTISTAPVIFVVGAVTKPGAFTVQDQNSRMTVLQAVAMAEGTKSTASLGRTIIVRQSSNDTERREIPVDLKKLMRGKEKDEVLEANDILFVPESGLKAGMRRMGDIGAQAAGQTLGYGLGLRIAP
jgi:polysaccharide export outer membrane protein